MEQTAFIKQPVAASKRLLEQLINCFLCNDKVRAANMCPHCCKLFCESCIKCVLEGRADCPHCHKPLKMSNMTQCSRFMNEVSSLLEQLIQHRNLDQLCLDHNVAQDYYCKDCMLPICCECSFFGEHHDHSIESLKSVYQPKVGYIRVELQTLRKRIKQIQHKVLEFQDDCPSIKKQRSRLKSEIQENEQSYKLKILHDTVSKHTELQDLYKQIKDYLLKVEKLESQLQKHVNSSNPISQIETQKNQQQYRDLIEKQFQIPVFTQSDMSFLVEIFPEFIMASFTLPNFSKKLNLKEPIYSPSVNYDGNQWCLKIYPTGCDSVRGSHLTIFLELRSSLTEEPVKYEYKIQLINHKDSSKSMLRSFASMFGAGQTWGYQKYIQIGKLLKQGYLDKDDCLEINYYIRPLNYAQVSKQKQLYIKALDLQLQKQVQEMQMLENSY